MTKRFEVITKSIILRANTPLHANRYFLAGDPRQFADPLSNAKPMLACGGEMMGFAYALPILRSFGACKRFAHALRVVGDDGEMGAGGLVGLAAALLPVGNVPSGMR